MRYKASKELPKCIRKGNWSSHSASRMHSRALPAPIRWGVKERKREVPSKSIIVPESEEEMRELVSQENYVVELLVKELLFPRDLAIRTFKFGAGSVIAWILLNGFHWVKTKLLFVLPNLDDPNSIHFFNCGNFGLPAEIPGSRPWPHTLDSSEPWPLDENEKVYYPPMALCKAISDVPAVEFAYSMSRIVFHVPNRVGIKQVVVRLANLTQFSRWGKIAANQLGIPEEKPLLELYSLSWDGPPENIDFSNSLESWH